MGITTSWKEEGRVEGIRQDLEQGREEGLRSGLRVALELKFASSAATLGERLNALPTARLLEFKAALLQGLSLEELSNLFR